MKRLEELEMANLHVHADVVIERNDFCELRISLYWRLFILVDAYILWSIIDEYQTVSTVALSHYDTSLLSSLDIKWSQKAVADILKSILPIVLREDKQQ